MYFNQHQNFNQMKNIIVISLSILFLGIFHSSTAQSNEVDKFTVEVNGLGCSFCAVGLEKKFKELEDIKEIKIDLETGIMTFEYPNSKELSIKQVKFQVEEAGYSPVKVSIIRTNQTMESQTFEVEEE